MAPPASGRRHRSDTSRRTRATTWLIVALALVAAACGDTSAGDQSSSSEAAGDQVVSTPTSAPSASDATATQAADDTVVDVLVRSADFTRVLAAVERADLVDTLRQPGPYTVFAPTDAGFDQADPAFLAQLDGNPDLVAELLLAHVVAGRWTTDELQGQGEPTELETLAGTTLLVARDAGDVVTVNERSVITQPNLEAGNGVVHAVDELIVPPDLEAQQ